MIQNKEEEEINTETKNNKCLTRQGGHNSDKPIAIVPELKKYRKDSKATYDDLKKKRAKKTIRHIT